ncbi:MAG TPA: hypothetical protein VMF31_11245 [Solirubrobacterales bacterium]|nr:hypothetical protein [Solirubrobacterales bacterium]
METQIEPDLKAEAERLLDACDAAGIEARLLGGLAIQIALGDRRHPAFARTSDDIDLITTRKFCTEFERLIETEGWAPEKQFNALNGARRLLFKDPADPERKIDGFVDSFSMCHELPLTDRFAVSSRTLSPADLLLTKLQIIELNPKDRNDSYSLLFGFPVSTEDGPDVISSTWIADLASSDWGLNHTIDLNLGRLDAGLGETELSDAERLQISGRIAELREALEAAPKSRGWKLRARIGERKKWYDEPEEVDRD